MVNVKKRDYKSLWEEYITIAKPAGLSSVQFCEQKKIPYSTVADNFAKLKREAEIAVFRAKNPELLLKAQANVENALNSDEVDPRFSLKTLEVIADREGLSPAAQIINIQAQATAGFVLAPMFASPTNELKKLLGEAGDPS